MLVLTREQDEVIVIGSDIEVKVLKIGGGKVKLGITAPEDVLIFREEVLEDVE